MGPKQLRISEIIDKLMSVMFQLEPLKEWQRRQSPYSTSSSSSSQSPPSSPPRTKINLKRTTSKSLEKELKRRRRSRGPYVCPPLSNIQLGISKEDLHNLYNLTDLQQWCKDNNIEWLGKKSLIINRIFTFLETGDVPFKKPKKLKKKRSSTSKK